MLKEIFWDMHTISHATEARAEIEYTETEGENGDLVAVAFSQLGNVGGEPYWSWNRFLIRLIFA